MKTDSHPLLLVSFVFIIVIAVLHFFALPFLFYWRFPWFDSLMHFLGGVWLAASFMWLFNFSPYRLFRTANKKRTLLLVFSGALLVSILWEVFEYFLGEIYLERYLADTAGDLFFALLGVSLAWLVIKRVGSLAKTVYE